MSSGKNIFNFTGTDEVGSFWIVCHPSELSVLEDIYFKCDIFDFVLQFRGGLKPSEIYGIYREKENAMKDAGTLLNDCQ